MLTSTTSNNLPNKVSSHLLSSSSRASAAARGLAAKIKEQTYRCSSVAVPSYEEDADDDDGYDNNNSSDYNERSTNAKAKQHLDAYNVLHLDRHFAINHEEMKQSYRNLMNQLHPDKHSAKPTPEQEELRDLASEVTQSYQILKDPHTRAMHLLQLMGKVEDMNESLMGQLLGSDGNMLLMEVMEIREAVEEASSNEELQPLLEENSTRIQDVCNQLADAFETEDLDKALELTVTLQYFTRIEHAIHEKMDLRWR